MEANRKRFPNIDDAELESRRQFANDCKALVLDVISTVNSPRSQNKIDRDARSALMGSGGKSSGKVGSKEGGNFIQAKQQEANQLVERQDEILTDMTAALDRLKGVSVDIQGELGTQTKIISQMTVGADTALGNMELAFGKMDALTGKSSSGRWFCILFLIVIIFVEIILIVYL